MTQVVKRIDSLLDNGSNLLHLRYRDREATLEQFKDYNTYTGKAVYLWQDGIGLHRLDVPHIHTPHTEDLVHVITHIAHSRHFGIYLLEGYGRQLEDPSIAKAVEQLNHAEWRSRHVLIFMDPEVHPHPSLLGQIVRRDFDL